ncbi:DDE-domain-containing protein [Glonium stellatum]|uniref:DDE-domain-containing protein n=1 Tax=Glonium stellatum TaxID=574774 RepID=A0A8E2F2P6_9PEZI|nr:DDE-domain-containing protein [Glonium stellatum]
MLSMLSSIKVLVAATYRSTWTTHPTPGFDWLKLAFNPQTKLRANGKPRILIYNGFGTHESLEVPKYCFKNNIILCRIPSHTSHKLQLCDVVVFSPLKAAYREQVEKLY